MHFLHKETGKRHVHNYHRPNAARRENEREREREASGRAGGAWGGGGGGGEGGKGGGGRGEGGGTIKMQVPGSQACVAFSSLQLSVFSALVYFTVCIPLRQPRQFRADKGKAVSCRSSPQCTAYLTLTTVLHNMPVPLRSVQKHGGRGVEKGEEEGGREG